MEAQAHDRKRRLAPGQTEQATRIRSPLVVTAPSRTVRCPHLQGGLRLSPALSVVDGQGGSVTTAPTLQFNHSRAQDVPFSAHALASLCDLFGLESWHSRKVFRWVRICPLSAAAAIAPLSSRYPQLCVIPQALP